MIMEFADNSRFVVDDVQTKEVLIENVMRPGLTVSAVAANKKDLRGLEDMFDEDLPELRESILVYPHEKDPNTLATALDNLDEDVPGPTVTTYGGFTKMGSANYEKFQVPKPEATSEAPTGEPEYSWRLTVEIGQRAYNEQ